MIQSQVKAMQKQKYDFKENAAIIEEISPLISQSLEISLASVKRQLEDKGLMDTTLITASGTEKKVKDFIKFIEADQVVVKATPSDFFTPWYSKYVEKTLEQIEEEDLLRNNEDYRMLVKEYREGILLFSLMNEQVWQKALEDTLGQRRFYEENIHRYQWDERVPALIIKMNKEEQLAKIRRFLADKPYNTRLKPRVEDQFLNDYPLLFTLEDGTFEIKQHPILKNIDPKERLQEIRIENKTHFLVLGNKLPAGPKQFSETTGKVIQDYQEYLDETMIAELREKYIIQINEDEKEKAFETINK